MLSLILLFILQAAPAQQPPGATAEPPTLGVLCPTETDKKPQVVFKKNTKVAIFACGSVDENRPAPPGKTWMTKLIVYTYKEDGTPISVLENESYSRNFFVSTDKEGMRADEIMVFDLNPETVFSTRITCEGKVCRAKTLCVKPYHKYVNTKISYRKLLDSAHPERAEEHLRAIFRSALSGHPAARNFFNNKKLKDKLESFIRDQYDRYEGIVKTYTSLGC